MRKIYQNVLNSIDNAIGICYTCTCKERLTDALKRGIIKGRRKEGINMVTTDMIKTGADKYINTFEAINRMGKIGDGSKETCLKMIQSVYPDWKWKNLHTLLFCLSYAGLVEGLTFENKDIVEPIRPKLTDKAKAEIAERKKVAGYA